MKGNLMILVCFLAGVFVGLGDFAPEWLLGHDLPIIILSLLRFEQRFTRIIPFA